MNTRILSERQSSRANGTARRVPRTVNGFRPPKNQKRGSAGDRFVLLPAFHSESGREALLQTGTGSRADRIIVAYHAGTVEFALAGRGRPLLGGTLASRLFLDASPVELQGEWKSVCWHSDGDADYLELQLCCDNGVRIDRQFLLSRGGHFALIADAVICKTPGRLDYGLHLPLAETVRLTADGPTRECRISAPGTTARAFPLGFPQDRVVSAPGSLSAEGGALEVTQVAAGGALYAPLLLDWHPKRIRPAAEWRSLTVSEQGQAVSADRAVGFRLRVGSQQLLLYRSLALTDEPRAVLGYHTRYETVIGHFGRTGEVDPIMMVETTESLE